jgi:hypothetical protein
MLDRRGYRCFAFLALLAMFGLSGASCPNLSIGGGGKASALEGTWKGSIQGSVSMTAAGQTSQTSVGPITYEVAINSHGRPLSLNLLVSAESGSTQEQGINVFETGDTKSYDGSFQFSSGGTTTTMTWTVTVTVNEAETTADGFHYAYDFTADITYSGGALSGYTGHSSGTITYDATLANDTLTFTETLSESLTSTGGGATQQGQMTMTLTGTLTRE